MKIYISRYINEQDYSNHNRCLLTKPLEINIKKILSNVIYELRNCLSRLQFHKQWITTIVDMKLEIFLRSKLVLSSV